MHLAVKLAGLFIALAVAAQAGGWFGYRQFSSAFSSGVKAASTAGRYGSSGESAPLGAVLAWRKP